MYDARTAPSGLGEADGLGPSSEAALRRSHRAPQGPIAAGRRPTAVSYTHLDVYKRQVPGVLTYEQLVANPGAYDQMLVTVRGRCV